MWDSDTLILLVSGKKQLEMLVDLVIYILITVIMYHMSSLPVVCRFWHWWAIFPKLGVDEFNITIK